MGMTASKRSRLRRETKCESADKAIAHFNQRIDAADARKLGWFDQGMSGPRAASGNIGKALDACGSRHDGRSSLQREARTQRELDFTPVAVSNPIRARGFDIAGYDSAGEARLAHVGALKSIERHNRANAARASRAV